MVHLQVDGCVHDCHNQALLQCETGGVHKLQENGKAFWVHFWIQADSIKVALVGVSKDGVKQPTAAMKKIKELEISVISSSKHLLKKVLIST